MDTVAYPCWYLKLMLVKEAPELLQTDMRTSNKVQQNRMYIFGQFLIYHKFMGIDHFEPPWAYYQKRKLRVAHAPRTPGMFSPSPTSKETAS